MIIGLVLQIIESLVRYDSESAFLVSADGCCVLLADAVAYAEGTL